MLKVSLYHQRENTHFNKLPFLFLFHENTILNKHLNCIACLRVN